ncbi:MAG TPA: hypothetical protein VJO33_19055 [Gemmatimonadaceae bacterium]|nr:hypothetical protein [Gemmatimonadaceae bacterium]
MSGPYTRLSAAFLWKRNGAALNESLTTQAQHDRLYDFSRRDRHGGGGELGTARRLDEELRAGGHVADAERAVVTGVGVG